MSIYNWGYLCLMICLLLTIFSMTIASGNWILALSLSGGLFGVLSGGLFGLAGGQNLPK